MLTARSYTSFFRVTVFIWIVPPSVSELFTLKREASSQDVQVMRGRETSLTRRVTSCSSVTPFLHLSRRISVHLMPRCRSGASPPHSASWQVTDSRPTRTTHSSVYPSASSLYRRATAETIPPNIFKNATKGWEVMTEWICALQNRFLHLAEVEKFWETEYFSHFFGFID